MLLSGRDGLRVALLCGPQDGISRAHMCVFCCLGPMELSTVALVALQTGMAPPAASGALEEVTRGQSGHPSGDIAPLCRLVQ